MDTNVKKINPAEMDDGDFHLAVDLLKQGDVIGFPTETVYGLGGLINRPKAIGKIFEIKNRPTDNPLIVHISSFEMLNDLVDEIPPKIEILCKKFWPGPLTILFKKSINVPDIITAGLPTVAIRMPSNRIALKLINLVNVPIAAPSANLSGRPSPTTALHVYHDLHGKIPLIIDGGKCELGVESTVIDVEQIPPLLLRPGGLNYEELKEYIPKLSLIDDQIEDNVDTKKIIQKPSTPGLKYKHYSPNAYVILIEQPENMMNQVLKTLWLKYRAESRKIGIIHTHNNIELNQDVLQDSNTIIINLTSSDGDEQRDVDTKLVAQELFGSLRALDNKGADIILVEGVPYEREGLAIMNRLQKAASEIN